MVVCQVLKIQVNPTTCWTKRRLKRLTWISSRLGRITIDGMERMMFDLNKGTFSSSTLSSVDIIILWDVWYLLVGWCSRRLMTSSDKRVHFTCARHTSRVYTFANVAHTKVDLIFLYKQHTGSKAKIKQASSIQKINLSVNCVMTKVHSAALPKRLYSSDRQCPLFHGTKLGSSHFFLELQAWPFHRDWGFLRITA